MLRRHLALTLTTTALLLGASPFSAVLAEDGTPPADTAAPETPAPDNNMAGPGGNKDGKNNGARAAHMFDQADINKDGVLTRDEMLAAHKKRVDQIFDKLDADKSGTVTKAEVETGREEIRKMLKEQFKNRRAAKGGGGLGKPGDGPAADGGMAFDKGE